MLLALPGEAASQLRPLDPFPWSALTSDLRWEAEMGVAWFDGERASLAGTEGGLWEVGVLTLSTRLDRVAVRATGTAFRRFTDREVFALPVPGTEAPDGRPRRDVGKVRVETLVLLASTDRVQAGLRFGTGLPTGDDAAGLERDRTDFWATLGGAWKVDPLRVEAEAGIAIVGTRDVAREQVDPVVGSLAVRWSDGPGEPWIAGLWQVDTRGGADLRGAEDVREVRGGLRWGERWTLSVTGYAGFTDFDPDRGLEVTVGRRW